MQPSGSGGVIGTLNLLGAETSELLERSSNPGRPPEAPYGIDPECCILLSMWANELYTP